MTPEEIQQLRQQYGVTPIVGSSASIEDKISFLKGTSNSNQNQNQKEPSLFQKAVGVFANPIIESGVRAGQAVGATVAKIAGIPNEKINAAMEKNTKLPLTGGDLKPVSQETPESVLGRGVSTVALGVGSPVAGGALLGAGSAMEQNKGIGGVAIETILSALAGKILDVGLTKAMPYIEKAVAKYGTPIAEKLQAELPDYAKPYLDKFINAGNKKASEIASKEFNASTDILKSETSIDFNKARERAWQDISPKPTPTTKNAYAKGGNVTEQGKITSAKILPTKSDEPVLESYQKLYQDGTINSKMSPKEKLGRVEERAAQYHQDQKNYLIENNKAVSLVDNNAGKGIISTIEKTAKNNSLIFAGNEKSAYNAAIDVFKRKLKTGISANATKGATTLTKIDEALTYFDNEMEKFGAWERRNTGQLTETDKARIQAIRDVHTSARDYIGEQLGPNNPWISIRKEESNLYQAADALSLRLGDTVGKSQIGQFLKEHPNIKKFMWYGIGALGGGAAFKEGMNLLP